jgi:hypothetical protein
MKGKSGPRKDHRLAKIQERTVEGDPWDWYSIAGSRETVSIFFLLFICAYNA